MPDAAAAFAQAVHDQTRGAKQARWLTVAAVTAVDGNTFSAAVDGGVITGIAKVGGYTPVVGEPALVGTLRGEATVQYVGVGAIGVQGTSMDFAFHGDGAPVGDNVDAYDVVDYPGIATAPTPYGPVDQSGDPYYSAWSPVGNAAFYDSAHTHPDSPAVSIRIPALTWPGVGQPNNTVGWWLAPYNDADLVRPNWVGSWIELEFSIYLTGYPPAITGHSTRIMLARFYPAASLWLTQGGYLEFAGTGKVQDQPFPTGTQVGTSNNHVPLNSLTKIKMRIQRDGQNYVRIYNDPTATGNAYNDWIHLGGVSWDFGVQTSGDVPFLYVGPHILPGHYSPAVVYPAVADPITMPQMWLDELSLRFDPPTLQ